MSETVESIRDGQIYRWAWKDLSGWPPGSDPYWCKSCIAVVKNGLLYDTYWHSPGSEHRLDPAKVDLTFFADESWPKISDGEALRYDPADVRNTGHANHSRGTIYIRPGAQLNKAAMLAVLAEREADARSDIRVAEWRLEEIAKKRTLLEAGDLNEVRL